MVSIFLFQSIGQVGGQIGGNILGQLAIGIPIVGVVILIAFIYFWRTSKKNQTSMGGNIAIIMTAERGFVVDMKAFDIYRETDMTKNITATYAIFPEELKSNGGFFAKIKQKLGASFLNSNNSSVTDEQKIGRTFDPELATVKRNGGWLTIYTLDTNTQLPFSTNDIEFKALIAKLERNVEKRMSLLKSVQLASKEYENASQYDQLGSAIKISAFAILLGLGVLAIVIMQIPGSIDGALNHFLAQLTANVPR